MCNRTKGNVGTMISGFLGDLEESVPEGGEVALMLEYESDSEIEFTRVCTRARTEVLRKRKIECICSGSY